MRNSFGKLTNSWTTWETFYIFYNILYIHIHNICLVVVTGTWMDFPKQIGDDDLMIQSNWTHGILNDSPWKVGNSHHPNWLIFLRGIETTNQMLFLFLATDVILPTWSLRAIIRCSFRISSPGVAFMTAKHGSVLHCKIEPQDTILLKGKLESLISVPFRISSKVQVFLD